MTEVAVGSDERVFPQIHTDEPKDRILLLRGEIHIQFYSSYLCESVWICEKVSTFPLFVGSMKVVMCYNTDTVESRPLIQSILGVPDLAEFNEGPA